MQTRKTHITKSNHNINITKIYIVLQINTCPVQTVHMSPGYFSCNTVIIIIIIIIVIINFEGWSMCEYFTCYGKMTWNAEVELCPSSVLHNTQCCFIHGLHEFYIITVHFIRGVKNFLNKDVDAFSRKIKQSHHEH